MESSRCSRCFEQFKLLHELCDSDEAAYIVSTSKLLISDSDDS